MHIVVHDYSGHPFQVQLSRELARGGHIVRHQFCSSYATGKGALSREAEDPTSFSVEPLSMGGTFARYSPAKRVAQELRYGLRLGRSLRRSRPDVIMMCNIPLLAHAVAAALVRAAGIPMVFWHQDVYSSAIGDAARRRLGVLGGPIARVADGIERAIARSSAHVVPISEAFLDVLSRWGVPETNITVIPNWAALPEMPVRTRDNAWARDHDLVGRNTVLYSGTLGLKHNPQIFVDLAQTLAAQDPSARVVVISEGRGREYLEREQKRLSLSNLVLLDYQPYEQLPDALAAADVLVAVLEPDSGRYSVPSKVLNYLCAARPVLAVMPASNGAASTLLTSGAGVVVDPADSGEAVTNLLELLSAPQRREQMGAAGRRYAEATFDITTIGDRFESVLAAASTRYGTRSHTEQIWTTKETRWEART